MFGLHCIGFLYFSCCSYYNSTLFKNYKQGRALLLSALRREVCQRNQLWFRKWQTLGPCQSTNRLGSLLFLTMRAILNDKKHRDFCSVFFTTAGDMLTLEVTGKVILRIVLWSTSQILHQQGQKEPIERFLCLNQCFPILFW